jgi:DNA-binding CsgD family transcriptional regulator
MPDVPRLGSGIPLVGRSAQMRQLRSAFSRACDGSAGAVLVSGDAGVGKSRLLDELIALARAEGAVVLSGRCLDVGETGLPYLPFAEAISALREHSSGALLSRPALGRLVPGMAPARRGAAQVDADSVPRTLLTDALPPEPASQPGQPNRHRPEHDMGQLQLFDAVYGLLTELASQGCVLLAIEDLHWADGSTRDLLSFLLSRLRLQQLLVVATYRSDDLHRRHPLRPLLAELFRLPSVERLDLEPFGPADAREFVAALADESTPEHIVQQIVQRSEGNAFFAEELVAAYTDRGAGMPSALADVLLSRIERLSPAAQRVVRAAAVGGRRVRYGRLPAVVDVPELELEEALREAVQHNVLVTVDADEEYAFRHALLAEAVYADLLPGERVRLHAAYARQLAKELDERGSAAELAHHSLQSHDLQQALTASVRAAEEAVELGAPAEALQHLEQALKLWDAVPTPRLCCGEDELTLLHRASHAAGSAGEPERAIAYGRSAVRVADQRDDPEKAAEARRKLAQRLASIDGFEQEAADVIEQAWELLRDREPSPTKAWVLAIRSMIQRWCADDECARESAEQAVQTARTVGAGAAEADALVTLAGIDGTAGHIEEACQRLAVARDRAAEAGAINTELRAVFNLAVTRYEQGRLAEAVRVFDEGAALAADTGLPLSQYGLWLRTHQAIAKYVAGDWDGSAAAAEPQGDGGSGLVTAVLTVAGLPVAVGRGEFTAAAASVAQLEAERHTDSLVVQLASAAAAELELWRDRPERAVAHVEDAMGRLRDLWGEALPLGGIRLDALGIAACADLASRARRRRDKDAERDTVRTGQRMLDHARQTARHGRPRAGELGPEGRAWLARAEAEATRLDGPGSVAAWRQVVEEFGYGHVYEQAIARWRLAGALLADEQRDEAAAELQQAAEVARRLGAVPLAKAVRQLARRARITLGDAAPAPAEATELLTPRELAVLGQVALGRTNRQVGEELYISEKTVSVHLSRVMAKLGVSSRTEAVAVGYDRGLLTATSDSKA